MENKELTAPPLVNKDGIQFTNNNYAYLYNDEGKNKSFLCNQHLHHILSFYILLYQYNLHWI